VPAWWILRRPKTRLERWIHSRPSLVSFRTARLRTYLELGGIRLCIFLPQAIVFYMTMLAFRIHVPLLVVVAVTPAILAAGGVPFTPTGLGPLQAVAIDEFARYTAASRVLAVFLALECGFVDLPSAAGTGVRWRICPGHPEVRTSSARANRIPAQHPQACGHRELNPHRPARDYALIEPSRAPQRRHRTIPGSRNFPQREHFTEVQRTNM
jgi:hypothetical protein